MASIFAIEQPEETEQQQLQRELDEALLESMSNKSNMEAMDDGPLESETRDQTRGHYGVKKGEYASNPPPTAAPLHPPYTPETVEDRKQRILSSIQGKPGDSSTARHVTCEFGIDNKGRTYRSSDGKLDPGPRNSKARKAVALGPAEYSSEILTQCWSLRGTKWTLTSKKKKHGISVNGIVVHICGRKGGGANVQLRLENEVAQRGGGVRNLCDLFINIDVFLPGILDEVSDEDSDEDSDVSHKLSRLKILINKKSHV